MAYVPRSVRHSGDVGGSPSISASTRKGYTAEQKRRKKVKKKKGLEAFMDDVKKHEPLLGSAYKKKDYPTGAGTPNPGLPLRPGRSQASISERALTPREKARTKAEQAFKDDVKDKDPSRVKKKRRSPRSLFRR